MSVLLSSKRAVDESEVEVAERRSVRCVWVSGGRALTEQEAAIEIVSEARLLLQEDLARLGVQWDPGTLPPGAPPINGSDDHHSSHANSEKPSGSHATHRDKIRDQKEEESSKKKKSRHIDSHREEDKEEEQGRQEEDTRREHGKTKPEQMERKLDKQIKEDKSEAHTGQSGNERPVDRVAEPKQKGERNTKLTETDDTENPSEKRELHKRVEPASEECKKAEQGGETRPKSHPSDQPVPERSLTQELAEIVSSPLHQPLPLPQSSPSPMPPPRFRAPLYRVDERHSVSTGSLNGDGATALTASPVQPGKLKHCKALSKVLHSIQTDKTPQDKVDTVPSEATVVVSIQTSGPPAEMPTTIQTPPNDPVPKNAESLDFPLSSSPASVPLFSPEAKRRRIEGGEMDKFSSPELYAGDEKDEEGQGDVQKDMESFGDSFELDTQTERIIVQHACKHRGGEQNGMNRPVEENVEAAVEMMDEEKHEGRRDVEACVSPDNACPRFNISLTDSQMELILNTSHQVSDHNDTQLEHKVTYRPMLCDTASVI